jgi:hypothetical protein
MRKSAVGLADDQLELLEGITVTGLGLAIRGEFGDPEDESGHFDLEVMPFWADPSQLHIDLTIMRHLRLETAGAIEQRMKEAYDYLCDRTTRFIASF